jgi:hypothetical protein
MFHRETSREDAFKQPAKLRRLLAEKWQGSVKRAFLCESPQQN